MGTNLTCVEFETDDISKETTLLFVLLNENVSNYRARARI
jgi:hypothetical protein